MNKNILFTIVIANYNHSKFIEQAINSIHYQNFKNYELFVLDANSTDESVEVIKKNSSKITWWISEPDSGQSEAFNKGFKRAKGDFLFWLNADDVLLPNSLEIASEVISKNKGIEWFAANTIFFDVNGLITKCTNGPNWSNFLFNNAPITVYGPTTIFSKNIFNEVGCFDESLHFGMDTDLWYRFKKAGYSFKRIPSYFWGFRIHSDSKTSHAFEEKPSAKFSIESLRIRKKNNIKITKEKVLFQKIFKLLNGNYIKSYFDTKNKRGRNIINFK